MTATLREAEEVILVVLKFRSVMSGVSPMVFPGLAVLDLVVELLRRKDKVCSNNILV